MDISRAMRQLIPSSPWSCGDTYESIQMLDTTPKPSKADLAAAWAQVQADDAAKVTAEASAATDRTQIKALLATLQSGTGTVAQQLALHRRILARFIVDTLKVLLLLLFLSAPLQAMTDAEGYAYSWDLYQHRGHVSKEHGMTYTGRVLVRRWGVGMQQPIAEYPWNLAAGNRWMVLRECAYTDPITKRHGVCFQGPNAPELYRRGKVKTYSEVFSR